MQKTCLLLLLGAVAACMASTPPAQLRCWAQEMPWVATGAGGWMAEVDLLDAAPALLTLSGIELAAVGENRCVRHQHTDYVVLGWGAPHGGSVPFAMLPTKCDDARTLAFGVGSLASEYWGVDARHMTEGTVVAPQGGRVDFVSGLDGTARRRTLHLFMASGTVRAPSAPTATLMSCVVGTSDPADLPAGARTVPPPRLVPLAECVHEFGGHCGVNVGWVNSARNIVELEAHTDDNRLHPTGVENGWHLRSEFAIGVHRPNDVRPQHMHLGWACGLSDEMEVKWHLDGLTLHLDHWARRCERPDTKPGQVIDWQSDGKTDTPVVAALATQSARPHTVSVSHAHAQAAWHKAGVEDPVVANWLHNAD